MAVNDSPVFFMVLRQRDGFLLNRPPSQNCERVLMEAGTLLYEVDRRDAVRLDPVLKSRLHIPAVYNTNGKSKILKALEVESNVYAALSTEDMASFDRNAMLHLIAEANLDRRVRFFTEKQRRTFAFNVRTGDRVDVRTSLDAPAITAVVERVTTRNMHKGMWYTVRPVTAAVNGHTAPGHPTLLSVPVTHIYPPSSSQAVARDTRKSYSRHSIKDAATAAGDGRSVGPRNTTQPYPKPSTSLLPTGNEPDNGRVVRHVPVRVQTTFDSASDSEPVTAPVPRPTQSSVPTTQSTQSTTGNGHFPSHQHQRSQDSGTSSTARNGNIYDPDPTLGFGRLLLNHNRNTQPPLYDTGVVRRPPAESFVGQQQNTRYSSAAQEPQFAMRSASDRQRRVPIKIEADNSFSKTIPRSVPVQEPSPYSWKDRPPTTTIKKEQHEPYTWTDKQWTQTQSGYMDPFAATSSARQPISTADAARLEPAKKRGLFSRLQGARKHDSLAISAPSKSAWHHDTSVPPSQLHKDHSSSQRQREPVFVEVSGAMLRMTDRVVWPSDEGPQFGTVRFVGYLCNFPKSDGLIVGVEFDNPVGAGTGTHEGTQVFVCPPNHASFMPIGGLIKEEDYFNQVEQAIAKPTRERRESQLSQVSTALSASGGARRKMSVGTCVQTLLPDGRRLHGVLRWMGPSSDPRVPSHVTKLQEWRESALVALVEMEEDLPQDVRTTTAREAIVAIDQLSLDERFAIDTSGPSSPDEDRYFGEEDSGTIAEDVTPINKQSLDRIVGRGRGIQGHLNSCYLDATLFAMFAFSDILDESCLHAKAQSPAATEAIEVLRSEVVYPLRRHGYVRADRITKLRKLIAKLLPNVKGITTEEKDPEELLTGLFSSSIFNVSPFVHFEDMNSCTKNSSHLLQVTLDSVGAIDDARLTDVQWLIERSFFDGNRSFTELPRVLIVQLPRSGTQRLFDHILPQTKLDLSYVCDGIQPVCGRCTVRPAVMRCPECYLTAADCSTHLSSVSYCKECFQYSHAKLDHTPAQLSIKSGGSESAIFEIGSVLCIEQSHYVAFSRPHDDNDSWVFYDSMADRSYETGPESAASPGSAQSSRGFNVPCVSGCPNLAYWLSSAEGYAALQRLTTLDMTDQLPDFVRRLLRDCYVVFYYRVC